MTWKPGLFTRETIKQFIDTLLSILPYSLGIDEIIPDCEVVNDDPDGVGAAVYPRLMLVALRDQYQYYATARGNVNLVTGDYCTVLHIRDGDLYEILGAGSSTGSSGVPITMLTGGVRGDILRREAATWAAYNHPASPDMFLKTDANDPIWSSFPAVEWADGESRTVKAAGGDHTTIQDALDWARGRFITGRYRITADAGTYNESLWFEGLGFGNESEIELLGDTRVLAGLTYTSSNNNAAAWAALTPYIVGNEVQPTVPNQYTYVCTVAGNSAAGEPVWPVVIGNTVVDGTVTWQCYGMTCNPEAFANGGTGVCMLNNPAGNQITVTMSGANPNFTNAGVVAGDAVLVFSNAGAITEAIVDQIVGGNTIQFTAAVAVVGNDGTSICLLPNRRIVSNGTVLSIPGMIPWFRLRGFYILSNNSSGVWIYNKTTLIANKVVVRANTSGILLDDAASYLWKATSGYTGALSIWGCAYGLDAVGMASAEVRYAHFVFCDYGVRAIRGATLDLLDPRLIECTTYGIYTGHRAIIVCTSGNARLCGTAYNAVEGSEVYANTTGRYNLGNGTNYAPAPVLPAWAQGGDFAILYASA
jgi:hypothetical protein